ncbi:hypothetical protein CAC42_1742 [Sphaceloma murrayae]|uniref:HTH araC/xylS-type domain-containing protein n=1 Tax=Sphaceloma murrayae TaxID=2082308 RepID=A0A2K1QIK3_9PEZI|nr:hypothetical protein CAC42_1742 [Sphaceloma murrayae]
MDPMRWAAVVARDKSFDGAFVYCVKSTKIYCRPTCAARLARRANVHFCDTSTEAESAGFRPCKRCKPELLSYTPQDDKIQQACHTICRYSLGPENVRLHDLAREAGLTKHHFHRLFKKKTGLTPIQYAHALRAGDTDAGNQTCNFTTLTSMTPSSTTSSSTDMSSPLRSDLGPFAFYAIDQSPASQDDLDFFSPGFDTLSTLDPLLLLPAFDSNNVPAPAHDIDWEWFDMDFPADPNADPIAA